MRVGVSVEQPGGRPHLQGARILAERGAWQYPHAITAQQIVSKSGAGGHLMAGV
jgi:hypothetical protein